MQLEAEEEERREKLRAEEEERKRLEREKQKAEKKIADKAAKDQQKIDDEKNKLKEKQNRLLQGQNVVSTHKPQKAKVFEFDDSILLIFIVMIINNPKNAPNKFYIRNYIKIEKKNVYLY